MQMKLVSSICEVRGGSDCVPQTALRADEFVTKFRQNGVWAPW